MFLLKKSITLWLVALFLVDVWKKFELEPNYSLKLDRFSPPIVRKDKSLPLSASLANQWYKVPAVKFLQRTIITPVSSLVDVEAERGPRVFTQFIEFKFEFELLFYPFPIEVPFFTINTSWIFLNRISASVSVIHPLQPHHFLPQSLSYSLPSSSPPSLLHTNSFTSKNKL